MTNYTIGDLAAVGTPAPTDEFETLQSGDTTSKKQTSAQVIAGGTKGSGTASVVIGENANASGENSTAFGTDANAAGTNSIAIGNGAQATGSSATAIGDNAIASGLQALALGNAVQALGEKSRAIGWNSIANGYGAYANGYGANATGNDAVAIGGYAQAAHNGQAIGMAAQAMNTNSLALGLNSNASGIKSTVIGAGASDLGQPGVFSRALSQGQHRSVSLVGAGVGTVRLTSDGAAAGALNVCNIPDNTCFGIDKIVIVGRAGSDSVVFELSKSEILSRGTGAGSTEIPTSSPATLEATGGTATGMAITASIAADTTNGGLDITISSGNGLNWAWRGFVSYVTTPS